LTGLDNEQAEAELAAIFTRLRADFGERADDYLAMSLLQIKGEVAPEGVVLPLVLGLALRAGITPGAPDSTDKLVRYFVSHPPPPELTERLGAQLGEWAKVHGQAASSADFAKALGDVGGGTHVTGVTDPSELFGGKSTGKK
jgi:hypothetical protein